MFFKAPTDACTIATASRYQSMTGLKQLGALRFAKEVSPAHPCTPACMMYGMALLCFLCKPTLLLGAGHSEARFRKVNPARTHSCTHAAC